MKKILSLFVVFAMLVVAAGCTNPMDKNGDTTDNTGAVVDATTEEVVVADDTTEKVVIEDAEEIVADDEENAPTADDLEDADTTKTDADAMENVPGGNE